MEGYWQGSAAIMLALIFIIILGNRSKDISRMLTVATCCFVGSLALSYLKPVVAFAYRLREISNVSPEILSTLLKAVGIGLIGEIACLICADSGNSALGKVLQLLTSAVILWLSLPLIQKLLDIVEEVLGEL